MKRIAQYLTSVLPAIVVITNQNTVEWKVLGEETQVNHEFNVNIGQAITDLTQRVNLTKDGNKTTLEVTTGDNTKKVDVTELGEDVIEVEQPQETKKVKIGSMGDKFVIIQEDQTAQTEFPVAINPDGKHVTLTTPTGKRYLGIFPSDAFDQLTKAKIIDSLQSDMSLTEGEGGTLEYQMSGEKQLKLFNLVDVSAPITLKVSALDGQVLAVDSPVWYKVLGFLWS